MKKLLLAALSVLAVSVKPSLAAFPAFSYVQISTNTNYAPTLQSGAMRVSSGTITNVFSTTGTITNFTATSSTMSTINATTIAVSTITPGNIVGTTTNNDAGEGDVGQYVEGLFNGNGATASGTYTSVSTITLSAGDWDISMNAVLSAASAGPNSVWSMCVSPTSGNNTTGCTAGVNWMALMPGISTPSVTNDGRSIANYRQKLNTSTPYYAKVSATYTGGTWQWFGILSARRRR